MGKFILLACYSCILVYLARINTQMDNIQNLVCCDKNCDKSNDIKEESHLL